MTANRHPRRRALLLAAAGMATSALAGCVSSLFFHPDRRLYTTPGRYGLTAHDLWFETADGLKLNGWWFPAQTPRPAASGTQALGAPDGSGLPAAANSSAEPPPRSEARPASAPTLIPAKGTVVHVHGNAANISNHLPQVAWLPGAGYNLLTFDYRGYGLSQGAPSLDGLVADTRAALAAARRQSGVDRQRLVVLGQSLGGATAVRALAEDADGVKLLILDSAFDSYRGIARDAVRGSSVLVAAARLAGMSLPGPQSDPLAAMARLALPVVILQGDRDRTVPPEHGQRLYEAARGPRTLIPVPEGGHIEGLTRPEIRARVLNIIQATLDGLNDPPRSADAPPPGGRAWTRDSPLRTVPRLARSRRLQAPARPARHTSGPAEPDPRCPPGSARFMRRGRRSHHG